MIVHARLRLCMIARTLLYVYKHGGAKFVWVGVGIVDTYTTTHSCRYQRVHMCVCVCAHMCAIYAKVYAHVIYLVACIRM